MTDEYSRLLGVRDGLHHALLAVGSRRSSITGPAGAYLPPRRHTRKRAAVERRLAELDAVRDAITRHLDAVKAALAARKDTPDAD